MDGEFLVRITALPSYLAEVAIAIRGGYVAFPLMGARWEGVADEILGGPRGVCGMNALTPEYLRCEYRSDPLGIDVERPRLSWILSSDRRQVTQSAYRILVAEAPGDLERDLGTLWDSGRVESDRSAQVEYGGRALQSHMQCYWKVQVWCQDGGPSAWSEVARWTMGLLEEADWQATWIGSDRLYQEILRQFRPGNRDAGNKAFRPPLPIRLAKLLLPNWLKMLIKQRLMGRLATLVSLFWIWQKKRMKPVLVPCPYLRREFEARGVRRATLYVTALGLYEVHVNGQRVGEDHFTPGWTDYGKRVYYQTYDVTDLMREGANALGAILSDGWYAGYLGPHSRRGYYGAAPRLALELHLDCEDGTTQLVVTDSSWKAGPGPLLEADVLMGERYDARREAVGWCEPGFDDSAWWPVDTGAHLSPRIEAMPHEPVRCREEIKSLSMSEPEAGCYVFDMGRNIAGWARLAVRGPAGSRVTLRYGERLDRHGRLYTANLRGARATDTYILKGQGREIWEPRFTYHGFQFVEVTGYPGVPEEGSIIGISLGSAMPETGSFECSNAMLNRLYRNIVTTQRANFIEVPTDCPQRDERLGWLGDAQVFLGTAAYNMDVAAFVTKWLADIRDAQSPEGAYPDVAPRVVAVQDGSPGWADAGVICPWILSRAYDDARIIERHYDSMRAWVDYLDAGNPDHLWNRHTGNNNGEWLPVDLGTPKEVLATAYFAYSTGLLAEMAASIGRETDAEAYRSLREKIGQAFNDAYVSGDGRIKGETQTCYVMALQADLLPKALRDKAARHLVEDIRRRGGHLSTGFFGTAYLAPVLTAAGHLETAYEILLQETFPSWGYTIRQGATSIWERWDGFTERKGFHAPLMNSFSHFAFGSIGEWLLSTVAGIGTEGPGYRQIVIHPRPGGGLTSARAHYDAISGRISSAWRIEEDRFLFDVSIPANTSAQVVLPAGDLDAVRESATTIDQADGVTVLRMEESEVILAIGSGSYRFAVQPFTPPRPGVNPAAEAPPNPVSR